MVNTTLATRITSKEKAKIMEIVKRGEYLSASDFTRQAVREKLTKIGEA